VQQVMAVHEVVIMVCVACLLLLKVCFKQNVHKHSLEFITAQAKLFEAAPATFTCADAASLYQDKKGEPQK
jgi:hypothetical protein